MSKIKVLIINLHGLGDNIAMTPAIREFKKNKPYAEIFLLVSKEIPAIKEFWSTNPYVDKVIVSGINFHPCFWNPFRFYFYDYWKILQEARSIIRKFNIKKIILIRNQFLPEFFDQKIPGLPKHRVDRIAFEMKVKVSNYKYDVFWNDIHEYNAELFIKKYNLENANLMIGLHTMPSGGFRRWELHYVKEVVSYLYEKYKAKFIHFHSKESYIREMQLENTSLDRNIVKNTAWEGLDILSTAALISKCNIMVAIDSAIAYLSNACNVPLLLLCRPKNPASTRLPKYGINIGVTEKKFSPEIVIPLIEKLLEEVTKRDEKNYLNYTSKHFVSFYNTNYFLTDAGGYIEYITSQGKILPQKLLNALRIAGDLRDKRILDVGCGRGEILLHSLMCGAKYVAGIDFSTDALKLSLYSLQQIKNRRGKYSLVCADATSLPFKSNYFDIVFLIDVAEHLSKEEFALCLKEIYRVLQKDGFLIIHTDNLIFQIVTKKLIRVLNIIFNTPQRFTKYEFLHINYLSKGKLHKELSKVGYSSQVWFSQVDTLEQVKIYFPVGSILANLIYWVGKLIEKTIFWSFFSPTLWAKAKKDEKID